MTGRNFRDRDFLRTKEGFLFCIVGPYHPKDRVISYLKYLPDSKGKWQQGRSRFKRVIQAYTIPNLLETFDILRKSYPQYLFFSETYNITMAAVPHNSILWHFKPEEKLTELFLKSNLDLLQKEVIRLVSILSELSNVPTESFGITGSILLDIHNPTFSDMDITVYGVRNSYLVKDALTKALTQEYKDIKRLDKQRLEKWYIHKTQNHPLNLEEARQIYKRKWNIGVFGDTLFSVHPIKTETETKEKYGDRTYSSAGTVILKAVVADSKDSIFLPAVYRVEEVELKEKREASIKEVISYEGLYDSLAKEDELIEAKGKLEHIIDNMTGETYDRVLIGSPEGKGREYIKPVGA